MIPNILTNLNTTAFDQDSGKIFYRKELKKLIRDKKTPREELWRSFEFIMKLNRKNLVLTQSDCATMYVLYFKRKR